VKSFDQQGAALVAAFLMLAEDFMHCFEGMFVAEPQIMSTKDGSSNLRLYVITKKKKKLAGFTLVFTKYTLYVMSDNAKRRPQNQSPIQLNKRKGVCSLN